MNTRRMIWNLIKKRPSDCSNRQLKEFETLVRKGDEVSARGLSSLIRTAEWLVFLYEGAEILAGIAALKNPRAAYKRKVFQKACSSDDPDTFVYEIGWLFVENKFRGRKLSRRLLQSAVELAPDQKVYATTRENNMKMDKTNRRCGFTVSGSAYTSDSGEYNLLLYIRLPT